MTGLTFGEIHAVLECAADRQEFLNYHIPVVVRINPNKLNYPHFGDCKVDAAAVELVSEDNAGKVYQLVLDVTTL